MKKAIKYILIFVIGGVFLSSCEEKLSNYETMTNDYDKGNQTHYIQFLNATASFETAIDADGLPTDIVTSVGVALLGAPQSSDITVTLSKNNSSTIGDNMWTLSSNTITIPAGGTSGSVTLTAIADEMIEDETSTLVLDMDAGGAEATSAYQINYNLKRIKFCPLEDLNDLVGTWSGIDSEGNASQVVTALDDGTFMIDGLNVGWMEGYWGEVIVDQVPLVMIMNPNGTLEIELQYYMETTWNGAAQPKYSVSATGKWDNCKKTMIINYDLHQGGDVLISITEDIALD
ncbi:MAG: DUF1735 domain-containing protein [Bacteroidales bacterium]|nr:DUF1735 domain-containing protein [Bacteroidales bacterium]